MARSRKKSTKAKAPKKTSKSNGNGASASGNEHHRSQRGHRKVSHSPHSKWGKDNRRLSRDPADLLARFNEQEAKRYEKIVRIRERAEKLGDKKTATAAKKIEKKLQSFKSASA